MLTPRENPDLFGHAAAEAVFEQAIVAGRMHHAWLISGPAGVGKATLAYRLARRLLAQGNPNDPASPVFRRIASGTHADLLSIQLEINEKTKKLKTAIAVEQTRDVTGFMHLTPAEGGWRVVVVDGADDMTPSAANAMLKILEEPSRRGILFLTTKAPGRLLPTIRSRCRRLPLDPLAPAAMDRALCNLFPAMEQAERKALARVAEGAPGQAVAMAGEGALPIVQLVDEMLAEAPRIAVPRMHEAADRATRSETGFSTFMTLLQSGLGQVVRTAARGEGHWPGTGDDKAGPASEPAPGLAEWSEVWHALGRLQDETIRFNLDKRAAVIAGLELLNTQ